VIGKLEEKREQLKDTFTKDYRSEKQKFEDEYSHLNHNCDQISQISIVFQELSSFVEQSDDGKVLSKINDITDFINKSVEDLEGISKN